VPALLGGALAAALAVALLVASQGGSTPGKRVALDPPPKSVQVDAWGNAVWGTPSGDNVPLKITVGDLQPQGRAFYEVWFGRGEAMRHSIGTFRVSSTGATTVSFTIPKGITKEYQWIWITREPDDGNPAPSPDTVLFADLA
jgi:hypothetical protein